MTYQYGDLKRRMELNKKPIENIYKKEQIKEERIIQEKIKQNEPERNLEHAINKIVHGEQWDKLYNDIIDHPSPEGKYGYIFATGYVDLHDFEDYMITTLPLINLKNVMSYKASRLLSKKKGYLQMERI